MTDKEKIAMLHHALSRIRAMCEDLKRLDPQASKVADLDAAIQEIDEALSKSLDVQET